MTPFEALSVAENVDQEAHTLQADDPDSVEAATILKRVAELLRTWAGEGGE